MLRFLFVCSIILGLAAYEFELTDIFKNQVNVHGNQHLADVEGVLHYKGSPFSGVTVARFPDGSIQKSTTFVNGIKNGEMQEYGFTGALRHRWNYKDGLKEGLQYSWYLEGPKKSIQNYKKGLFHGLSEEWFINGQLFRKRTFENGVEITNKVHFHTSELHTNYVKRDGAIYGLKTGELCMDFKNDGEL